MQRRSALNVLKMTWRFAVLLALSLEFHACSNECSRIDYGRVRGQIFNEQHEPLLSIKGVVHAIKFGTFEMPPSLTTLAMVQDHFGAQSFETDEAGNFEVEVSDEDATSSCDGPGKTFDNIFNSVVLFYICDDGTLRYQEFDNGNGLVNVQSVNQIDAIIITSDCIN